MDRTDKIGISSFVSATIWSLGIIWHPFGKPTILWHILFLGSAISLFVVYVYKYIQDMYKLKKEEIEIDGETFIVNRNGEKHQKTEVTESEKNQTDNHKI